MRENSFRTEATKQASLGLSIGKQTRTGMPESKQAANAQQRPRRPRRNGRGWCVSTAMRDPRHDAQP
jgi:hypothetical protein